MIRNRWSGAALAVVLVLASPGCSYLKARWRDFTDLASAGVGPGGGLGVRAEATKLVALEVMAQKDERFTGWRSRNFRWMESSYGLVFATWRMPSIGSEAPPERLWYDFFTTSRRLTRFPNRVEQEDERHTLFILSKAHGVRLVDALNVELGVSALVAGVEVGVQPLEVVDFLLGWFGLDIGRDDGIPYGETSAPPLPPPGKMSHPD
jgi:hypothetical protein